MPTVRVNGVTLHYETAGKGDPLLFIHGLGASSASWAPQIEAFRDRYQCVAFDVRGHGKSEKPPGPYSMSLFAADTRALIEHLGLSPVHVVGLSLGAMIAFQIAVDAPSKLRSMVVINGGPEVRLRTLSEKLDGWRRLILFRLFSMERIGKVIGGRLFPDESQAGLRAQFEAMWAENEKPAYLAATRALIGWSVREHIGSIQIPALLIAADQDYSPVEAKEAYVREMANAQLAVVNEARHAVAFAQPEKVNPLIAAFLGKVG